MLSKTRRLEAKTGARSMLRRMGLIPHLARVRSAINTRRGRDGYEDAFGLAMKHHMSNGDSVWDVGANVGLYSEQFAAWVGESGTVTAFEPTAACFAELETRVSHLANVDLHPIALGDTRSQLQIGLSSDPLGATHSLVAESGGDVEQVEVWPGDLALSERNLAFPNVVKVDVEGFEWEVLAGMQDTLASSDCRAVFCEVHFRLLDQRGRKHAPSEIVQNLEGHGFEVSWASASHLVALKAV